MKLQNYGSQLRGPVNPTILSPKVPTPSTALYRTVEALAAL